MGTPVNAECTCCTFPRRHASLVVAEPATAYRVAGVRRRFLTEEAAYRAAAWRMWRRRASEPGRLVCACSDFPCRCGGVPAEPESDQLIDRLARWLRWRDRRLQEVNAWLGLLKMAIDLRDIPRDDPDRRQVILLVRRLATLQRLHTAQLALSDAGRVRA